jgi:chemotaxis response regulator CheB
MFRRGTPGHDAQARFACFGQATCPPNLPAAVFVVLHVGAASYLSEILDRAGPLPAREARNGKTIEFGNIYAAPARLPPSPAQRPHAASARAARKPCPAGDRSAFPFGGAVAKFHRKQTEYTAGF